MAARRIFLVSLAALAVLTLGSAFAQAAKAPTYHVYKKCGSDGTCSAAAYLNKKQTRIVNLQFSRRCSDNSYVSAIFSGSGKVSKSGKFSLGVEGTNYDRTGGISVLSKGTASGTVSKKKKVTINYEVDQAPAACASYLKGKVTAKYKGTQSGG